MKINVFYRIAESLPGPRSSPELSILDVKKQLEELKAELTRAQGESRRREILRHIARIERFEKINLPQSSMSSENLGKILLGKSSETYTNSDLLSLQREGIDVAKLVLVFQQNPDKEVNSSDMKVGDIFTVNFGGNLSLRDRTGAGDILPPEVKHVKINGVECERRNKPRPGYYSNNLRPSYQVIYDGYTIEILGTGERNEADTTAIALQWKKERVRDTLLNDGVAMTDIKEDIEIAAIAKTLKEQRISLASYNPSLKRNGFSVETDEFKRFAQDEGFRPEDTEEVLRVMTAIFRHESGGSYSIEGPELAEGSHKGTKAIGRYQIMPRNWQTWSYEIFSEVVEPTPENQDKIAFYQNMKNYLRHSRVNNTPEYYVKEMASDWYGRGRISATTNINFNSNAPSTSQYADNILTSYKKLV